MDDPRDMVEEYGDRGALVDWADRVLHVLTSRKNFFRAHPLLPPTLTRIHSPETSVP